MNLLMCKSNHWSFLWRFLTAVILSVCFLQGTVQAETVTIEKIQIQDNPLSVRLHVSGKAPVKVVKVEPGELLVALKNAKKAKGFTIQGKDNTMISKVELEQLQGNVLAIILTSRRPYEKVKTAFNANNTIFTVHLGNAKKATAQAPAPQEKKIVSVEPAKPVQGPATAESPAAAEPAQGPVTQAPKSTQAPASSQPQASVRPSAPPGGGVMDRHNLPPFPVKPAPKLKEKGQTGLKRPVKVGKATVYIPPTRQKTKFQGDINDLLTIIEEEGCNAKQVSNAILMLKKKLPADAFKTLEQYVFNENFSCVEQAYFLRALAYYQMVPKDDFVKLMKAERMFQDALVMYPKSEYLPFGYAAIGIIQKKMNNDSAAEGYFNIVKQGYMTYPGLPEILYHLAVIYTHKGYEDKALKYFQQVFEDPVENSSIADAGIGYGNALFKKHQYLDALKVLDYVVESRPKKVYESHDLLLSIGNANFEVGQSKEARIALTRVLNLFPEVPEPDVILSKIADTYGMENNETKAIKMYELVREKYPDSKGYIASSMGIARYLKKDKDKIEIYTMVKTKFPEDTYARIAMMRMAEIYQKNGEYNKCIQEIEDLLSTHPRGLRYEAVKLMQQAYEALFKQQLKADEYTQILNRYELEHNRIDRMSSRRIELSVGLAYLEAKLHDQAFNHLINAYKQYKRSARSEILIYGLGVAMDESGRKEDALKMFNSFSKRFPKSKRRGEVLLRAGRIYLDQKNYALSSKRFETAFKISKDHLEKGKILLLHANVFEIKGDLEKAAQLREKAISETALAPGENYDMLTEAYKELGRTYIALKQYVKSARSYSKALSFSSDEQEKANLGFLLGDAYQKGNILQKAKDAYKEVVSSYDSVWARLAQQRLDTLELAEAAQKS